ncbi:MAG: glycosyltransferase family 2 protein [Candidatus ainarchaeum sp.]|nr:glycosyltransferase family 2 protein [Candidatus ainarchaeum sp.]
MVLIPAFNEEKTIARVIKEIPKKILGIGEIKIIVVNDGSSDRTIEEAKKAGAGLVVSHESNKGLGVAFRTGIENALKAGADIIVNIDADMQFNPKDIPKIIRPILDGKADFVTCTRFKDKTISPEMPFIKKFGNNVFTKLISILAKQKFTDTQCGFRAYSRETALHLNLFGKHTYTQEALLDAIEKGMRIVEVPCVVKGQREGKSRVVENWFAYSTKALLIIIRTVRDHRPLEFFGGMGFALFAAGTISALWLWARLLAEHIIDPFMWVAYADVILIVLGFLLAVLAMIADMNSRQRKLTEEILYRIKKQEFEK